MPMPNYIAWNSISTLVNHLGGRDGAVGHLRGGDGKSCSG